MYTKTASSAQRGAACLAAPVRAPLEIPLSRRRPDPRCRGVPRLVSRRYPRVSWRRGCTHTPGRCPRRTVRPMTRRTRRRRGRRRLRSCLHPRDVPARSCAPRASRSSSGRGCPARPWRADTPCASARGPPAGSASASSWRNRRGGPWAASCRLRTQPSQPLSSSGAGSHRRRARSIPRRQP